MFCRFGRLLRFSISVPSIVDNSSSDNRTLGWTFEVNTDLIVDGLGIWDDEIDGLSADHEIGIFDANENLIQSATVLSGMQSQAEGPIVAGGQWRFVDTQDLRLFAGQTYTIGALYNEDDVFASDAASVDLSAEINFIEDRFSFLNRGFAFPDDTSTPTRLGLFGPNFRFSAVPEPSSYLLLAGAGIAALVRRRRRK